MSYQLTKKEVIKEIVKCGKDPVYFINNYARISHPIHGTIPFKTYDFQTELLKDFNDYRFNVILKARQLGISTITAAYVAWMMMFHKEKNILVMATKFQTAANLVKKVKSIIKSLPDWMEMTKITIDNRTSFELDNGSQIKASTTSSDAGRSEALSLLVVDEAAHVEGLDELWTGLYPTLSTGGRCIALSTPNGVGNWFHQICVDAQAEKNDFHMTTLPWDVHPDRNMEWFAKETKNMSRRQIAQEFECNFNMSGETVIDPEDMTRLKSLLRPPAHRVGFDRNLWLWENYDPICSYFIVADVARGDDKDSSVFHILKMETMEIVGEYQSKITPDQFANLLFNTGKEFGDCMIVVENNSVGFSVLEKLKELGCANIYHSIKSTHEYVDQYTAEAKSNAIAGFSTTSKTRPLIVAKMEEFIRNKLVTIYSTRLFNELETFVWHNGRPQAMRMYNDDLVMSLAIGCWIRDTALQENKRGVEYSKVILNSMHRSGREFNTSIPGQKGYKAIETSDNIKERREFIWLLKG
jgi:hypothetical protein